MRCQEAHRLVVRAQDARLSVFEKIGLRLHLLICSACLAFERQMNFLRKACRNFPGDGDPE